MFWIKKPHYIVVRRFKSDLKVRFWEPFSVAIAGGSLNGVQQMVKENNDDDYECQAWFVGPDMITSDQVA